VGSSEPGLKLVGTVFGARVRRLQTIVGEEKFVEPPGMF
jgi:hypothetical protein